MGRRIRLDAPQHDLASITHTPGFTYSGDMEEPSPSDSQSTGQPLDTANTLGRRLGPVKTRHPKRPSSYFGPKSHSILVTFKTDFEARRKYLKVIINGKAVCLELDAASDTNLISKRTLRLIGRPSMITSHKKALIVSKKALQVMVELECGVSFDDIHHLMNTPIVAVKKATGKVRICADFSTVLNAVLKKTSVSKEYRELLTINTHHGLCQFTRLPFGVKTAPVIFQQTMDTILTGTEGAASNPDELLQRLETVLSRIQGYGLRLRLDK
ncbi:unnamed protein product [Schistocephalus solidus]|uniref:Reverse transcriptase domain-containing protein n=1 Tax=Schistocephalus solidus TaxID=70667 RepID=A0A183SG21_SCHSO|nr:unnamed protein product [Schistocephalus solidus]